MLIITSAETVTIWSTPLSGSPWPSFPTMTVQQTSNFTGAVFLGDESHIVVGMFDSSALAVYRVRDGVQTATYRSSSKVFALLFVSMASNAHICSHSRSLATHFRAPSSLVLTAAILTIGQRSRLRHLHAGAFAGDWRVHRPNLTRSSPYSIRWTASCVTI